MSKALATREQLETEGAQMVEAVKVLKVTSQGKYLQMVQFYEYCRDRYDKATGFMEDMRVKTYDAYQSVLESRRILRDPFEAAGKEAKVKMKDWERAEEAKVREQEAKRRAAEEAAEAAAKAAKKAGEEPPPLPRIPRVRENRAAQADVVYIDNWKSDQVDMVVLVKAAAKNPALLIYLEPNRKELNSFAKRCSGEMEIPGVDWINDKTVRR